jgi:hypothetical protein
MIYHILVSIISILGSILNTRLHLISILKGMYQLLPKVHFFIPIPPKLPRAKCTSCPHMLIYTQLQYIACKIGEVNIQIIIKIIYKNNVR